MNVLKLLLALAIVVVSTSTSAKVQGAALDSGQIIVGTWFAQKGDIVNRVTYRGDGTFRGHLLTASTGVALWTYEGNWTFEGNWLRYRYTKSDDARVRVGYRNQDEVIELDAEHFKIRTSTAEERTYTRVRR